MTTIRKELEQALREYGEEHSAGIIGEWIKDHAGRIASKVCDKHVPPGNIYTEEDLKQAKAPLEQIIDDAGSTIELIDSSLMINELKSRAQMFACIFLPKANTNLTCVEEVYGYVDSLIAALLRMQHDLLVDYDPASHTNDKEAELGDEEESDE